MGFFNWAAPMFGHFADRWNDSGVNEIADWVRPYMTPDGALLDVGGGTGALAKRLSVALAARVTVLDPAPQMLAYVDDGPRVTAVLGAAEAIPFDANTFDALIVTDAFHHFRDQPGAVREFTRVVRPGGGIIVVDLDPSGLIMRAIVRAEKLLGEPGAFFTPEQMCSFMNENGVSGTCASMNRVTYRFLGSVAH